MRIFFWRLAGFFKGDAGILQAIIPSSKNSSDKLSDVNLTFFKSINVSLKLC